jgi:RNA polymerase sigma-70 factor (ECF subfamily)
VDAYASLLRLHEDAARRLALVLCGGADADEAAQDAFVKAWYGLKRFRDGAPFRPWLLRIVANEARNRRRASGRRSGHELRFAADRASGGAAPSPEAAVLATDRRRTLAGALAELPARQRDIVACRYLIGLDEAETADVLGLPRGTVKSRAARGLARLRALLPERQEIGGAGDA